MVPLIIYHAHCNDGFGAAWAAWRAFNREAELHAASYGQAPPDVTGRNVFILDFSYKVDTLLEMATKASYLTLLDHHQTSFDDITNRLAGRDFFTDSREYATDKNNFVEFYDDFPDASTMHLLVDKNNSGAVLAWKHFFGDLPPPEILLHIEDRDLWRFHLPNTRAIHNALSSYPQELHIWDDLMAGETSELLTEGKAIERMQRKNVQSIIDTAQRMMWIGGYNVPVVNCNGMFASDVAGELAKGHSFAATYYDTAEKRKFSLRSIAPNGMDVAKIAEEFGGGGHKHAAGFAVSREHELGAL